MSRQNTSNCILRNYKSYNLLEYSWKYSDATLSSWFYCKDEATNFDTDTGVNDNFKSFSYKTKLIGNTAANGILQNVTVKEPFKYLSNFWKLCITSKVNYKVGLKLKCIGTCILPSGGALRYVCLS